MNYIPVFGWLMDLGFKMSLAVPFYICWTFCGLGKRYFYFLPEQYQSIPFWHCVGLFIAIPILLHIITPRLASVKQTVKTSKEKEAKGSNNG